MQPQQFPFFKKAQEETCNSELHRDYDFGIPSTQRIHVGDDRLARTVVPKLRFGPIQVCKRRVGTRKHLVFESDDISGAAYRVKLIKIFEDFFFVIEKL